MCMYMFAYLVRMHQARPPDRRRGDGNTTTALAERGEIAFQGRRRESSTCIREGRKEGGIFIWEGPTDVVSERGGLFQYNNSSRVPDFPSPREQQQHHTPAVASREGKKIFSKCSLDLFHLTHTHTRPASRGGQTTTKLGPSLSIYCESLRPQLWFFCGREKSMESFGPVCVEALCFFCCCFWTLDGRGRARRQRFGIIPTEAYVHKIRDGKR